MTNLVTLTLEKYLRQEITVTELHSELNRAENVGIDVGGYPYKYNREAVFVLSEMIDQLNAMRMPDHIEIRIVGYYIWLVGVKKGDDFLKYLSKKYPETKLTVRVDDHPFTFNYVMARNVWMFKPTRGGRGKSKQDTPSLQARYTGNDYED